MVSRSSESASKPVEHCLSSLDGVFLVIPVILHKKEGIMASEKKKPRILREIKEIKPVARGRSLSEGQDFSNLNAMLVKIQQQKKTKKN
jgi:hypothetical protein